MGQKDSYICLGYMGHNKKYDKLSNGASYIQISYL
jgi:hypothetical protein